MEKRYVIVTDSYGHYEPIILTDKEIKKTLLKENFSKDELYDPDTNLNYYMDLTINSNEEQWQEIYNTPYNLRRMVNLINAMKEEANQLNKEEKWKI